MNLNEVDIHYLIAAISVITSALVFYTIGVWGERLQKRLKFWHLVFFFVGTAGRFCGNGFNGEYCATHTLAWWNTYCDRHYRYPVDVYSRYVGYLDVCEREWKSQGTFQPFQYCGVVHLVDTLLHRRISWYVIASLIINYKDWELNPVCFFVLCRLLWIRCYTCQIFNYLPLEGISEILGEQIDEPVILL